jgi:hypothetical protein
MKKDLELINYEGPCLKLNRAKSGPDQFVIYDQWDSICDIITLEQLCNWLDGKFPLEDSNGKEWYYTKESQDAKCGIYKILQWIYGN